MNNLNFLQIIKDAFEKYLSTHPRSNEKLKILHGAISKDLEKRLNNRSYSFYSLGYTSNKEKNIIGRYINKKADIAILKDDEIVAGIAVKFVMSNYGQNSNNYFENMLGETANIRCANIPYFQVFVMPEKLPYYNKKQEISKWEEIKNHHIKKYITLSDDNIDVYLHTPNKTLICIVKIPECNISKITNKEEYKNYYLKNKNLIEFSSQKYSFKKKCNL